MFNTYTCNAITGVTGERLSDRAISMGLDVTDLKPQEINHARVTEKEVLLSSEKHTVSDLMVGEKFISYDLILRMMLKDGVVDHLSKVRIGSSGRTREVFVLGTKLAYRMWGKVYYGCVTPK